jgi:hypothetical protein
MLFFCHFASCCRAQAQNTQKKVVSQRSTGTAEGAGLKGAAFTGESPLNYYLYTIFIIWVYFKFSLAGEDLPLPAACLSGRQGRHQPGLRAVVGEDTIAVNLRIYQP